jgi:hypothetical protein
MPLKSAALAAVLASTSLIGLAGCMNHDRDTSHMNTPDTMSNDDMAAKGDRMIRQGKQMKEDASNMTDGEMNMGMSKQEMMDKGQKMIDEGQEMKTKALSNQKM